METGSKKKREANEENALVEVLVGLSKPHASGSQFPRDHLLGHVSVLSVLDDLGDVDATSLMTTKHTECKKNVYGLPDGPRGNLILLRKLTGTRETVTRLQQATLDLKADVLLDPSPHRHEVTHPRSTTDDQNLRTNNPMITTFDNFASKVACTCAGGLDRSRDGR